MFDTQTRAPRTCQSTPTQTIFHGRACAIPSTVSCLTVGKPATEAAQPSQARLFMFSAANERALQRLVASTYDYFTAEDFRTVPRHNVLSAGHRGFSHHRERLSIIGRSSEDIRGQLGTFLSNGRHEAAYRGAAVYHKQPVVFVFSGQGSQWWRMGSDLMSSEPVFRATLEVCDRLFRGEGAQWSLLDELNRDEGDSRMDQTAFAQPAIFALQVALVGLWRSWGITPDAVVGHSIGEVAAAFAAGILSLDEAARVAYHRGRCMESDRTEGQMLAAALSAIEAEELLSDCRHAIELAAINSPNCVTFAGEPGTLKELSRKLRAARIWRRTLSIPHAFHTAAMDPLRDRLIESLGNVSRQPSAIPMISTVTGRPLDDESLHAEYWWDNLRQPVRFADACGHLLRNGYRVFVEIGPHPVLAGCLTQCAAEVDAEVKLFASLRRDDEDAHVMLNSAGGLFALGANVGRRSATRSPIRQPAAGRDGVVQGIKVNISKPFRANRFRSANRETIRPASCIGEHWNENGNSIATPQ